MKITFQDSNIEFGELDKIADALKILDIEPISLWINRS
jgi:sulfur carrier protein ThiS